MAVMNITHQHMNIVDFRLWYAQKYENTTSQQFYPFYKEDCYQERGSCLQYHTRGDKNSYGRYQTQEKISNETTRDACDAVFQNTKVNKVTMDDTTRSTIFLDIAEGNIYLVLVLSVSVKCIIPGTQILYLRVDISHKKEQIRK